MNVGGGGGVDNGSEVSNMHAWKGCNSTTLKDPENHTRKKKERGKR
jgi:hypothetical protein